MKMNLGDFKFLISYQPVKDNLPNISKSKYLDYLNGIEEYLTKLPNAKFKRSNSRQFFLDSIDTAFELKMKFPDHIEYVIKHQAWTKHF